MWQEKSHENLKRVEEVGIVPLVWNGSSKRSGPEVRSDSNLQLIHKCMFPMRHTHTGIESYTTTHERQRQCASLR